ncbi:MAG TPA: helix-turn-helix transcriptional regulator [Chitinophagaceae bacterium]|jgi:transcriptional regulator with XRE-family HTH domain|nr:helix-turn-helix transcriptional regulator [Chitinophagaceae bacterium]
MGKDFSQDYLKKFGKNLKNLREIKGYSLRGLAAECKIDHSDIGKMERGEKNITLLTVLELASALQVHPKKLLDFDVE